MAEHIDFDALLEAEDYVTLEALIDVAGPKFPERIKQLCIGQLMHTGNMNLLKKLFASLEIRNDEHLELTRDSEPSYSVSLLEYVAMHGRMDLMDTFQELRITPREDDRLLLYSCWCLRLDMVIRLLSEGSDPNQRMNADDPDRRIYLYGEPGLGYLRNPTPLHVAALGWYDTDQSYEMYQLAIVNHLLAHGADPLAETDYVMPDGSTVSWLPIHVAMRYNCIKVVELLQDYCSAKA